MTKKASSGISNILVPILYGLLAIGVAMLVCWSGQYPFGSSTMNFIYYGDVVYDSIADGNIFALYDPNWYNGIEFLRSVAILPSYFMAFCIWLAGGDPIDGYLMFVGLVFFLGALSWYKLGKSKGRVLLGTFIGILWFFMPNNLYVLFFEGDLSKALCMVILPIFIGAVYDYLETSKWTNLISIIVSFALMTMCNLEYIVMITIGIVIFMILHGLINRKWKNVIMILGAMILSVCIIGVWLISAVIARQGTSNAESMQRYFQDIIKSLNPVERYTSVNRYYYFGIAAFLLCLFGVTCGRKKTLPAFLMALLILVSTSSSMYYVMKVIPGSDYLLMCQYITLALGIVLYALLMWKTLKKPVTIIICILLIVDVIPSMNLVYGTFSGVPFEERYTEQYDATLIAKAKEMTSQRMLLLDGGELESTGAYLVSMYEGGKMSASGGDWLLAGNDTNIAQINKALGNGNYEYLFDRCKELGNDTILIKHSQLNEQNISYEIIDRAAAASGYEVVSHSDLYSLYNMDIEGNWGLTSKYEAIGIGSDAAIMALSFPAMEEVSSTNIDDYTFEELSQYKVVYLSGFTYEDKYKAEELVVELSEAGVKVIILADGVPEDSSSHTRDFLDIICNDISFTNGYPFLETKVGVLDCDYFPQGSEEWNTVYVNGLDDVWGTVKEDGMELEFYGTVKNDNIIVVGLNLVYYHSITGDEGVGKLLGDITGLEVGALPKREIVPVEVEYKGSSMTISSHENNVNTTLTYHEMFNSDDEISVENNFLYVNKGTTTIKYSYPYLIPGIVVSIIGLVGSILLIIYNRKEFLKKKE